MGLLRIVSEEDNLALACVEGKLAARIWWMTSTNSSFCKTEQQLSPAVGDFSVNFSYRMRFLSSSLKCRLLKAAYYAV